MVPTFGTWGSQVQILPLRPTLSPFLLFIPDRFPGRNDSRSSRRMASKPAGLEKSRSAAAARTLAQLSHRAERARVLDSRAPSRGCAKRCDALAPSHSITSSASASNVGGTVRPSSLAVLRLSTNSNLVGACTGRSAGFSPLRTRSTYDAARRYKSRLSAP